MATRLKLIYTRTHSDEPLHMDIFHPDVGGKALPAVLFFFGGGWRTGFPHQFYPQASWMARHGIVALCAEYRVEDRHGAEEHRMARCESKAHDAGRVVRKSLPQCG